MSKILFISSLYSPNIGGGAEIIMQEQVEGLSRKGYECIVLTTKELGAISLDFVNNIKVYRAAVYNQYWHYKRENESSLSKLFWHIKDRNNSKMRTHVNEIVQLEKPDIVICHNLSGWSISVWEEIKLHNIPIIQVLHDMYLLCVKSTMYDNGKNCKRQCTLCSMMRKGFKKKTEQVDAVVGASQFILKRMDEYGYFQKSLKKNIYNQRTISANYDIKLWDGERTLCLGFIGTLAQNKGIELILKSFVKLSQSNIRLLVAGKGNDSYVAYLKTITENDSRIEFIGYSTPEFFFNQIDICVAPSVCNDTFPGVAIESCAYNTPVIVTRMGGLPEIVIDGKNGILIDPTPSALCDAIMYYYENAEILNEHKRSSREIVNKFLNFEEMINDYSDCIENL